MTSEVFVYLTLPGETSPVTAGRFELTTDSQGISVGRFVYGRRYLARPDAVPIDPVELKLEERAFQTARLHGMFGALRDASPDYWGRRVIEKHAGKVNLTELDYLLNSPDDRAGALGFGLNVDPPAPLRAFNRTMDLSRLQELADLIVAEEELPAKTTADRADLTQVQDLLLIGTAMGGARPKTVVEDGEALWIAKFNRRDDKWNNARVEHAMLLLARECGLSVSQSRLDSDLRPRRTARQALRSAALTQGLPPCANAECTDATACRGLIPGPRPLVVRNPRRGAAANFSTAQTRCSGTLSAHGLQRAHLKPRRSPPQSRRDCYGPRVEALAGVRPHAHDRGKS